jgi:hypothetical protein
MCPNFWVDAAEKDLLDNTFSHPSDRAIEWQQLVKTTTSQISKTRKVSKVKEKRKVRQLAIEWRNQQSTKSAAKALQDLVPTGSKGSKGSRSAKKARKNKKKQLKPKSERKLKKNRKKDAARLKAAASQAASQALTSAEHPLIGKAARVISDAAPSRLHGTFVLVKAVHQDNSVTVQAGDDTYYKLQSLEQITTDFRIQPSPKKANEEQSVPLTQAQREAIIQLAGLVFGKVQTKQLLALADQLLKIDTNFLRANKNQPFRIWHPAEAGAAANLLLTEGVDSENNSLTIVHLRR